MPSADDVSLREYVEALLHEQQRAISAAERERANAAAVLASSLERSIKEGDERLREHVANQIEQVRAALDSSEKLELERIDKVLAFVKSVQREVQIAAEASDKAIAKAETANEKRFDGVNDLRGSMADQAKDFMPREVADAQITELRAQATRIAEQLGKLA